MPEVVIWGAAAFGCAALAGLLSGAKNRDISFWMAWCFILPPLILYLALLPRRDGPRPRRPRGDEEEDRLYF